MKTKLDINPWLSIWTRPRDTIAKIVAFNPNHRLLLICLLLGMAATVSVGYKELAQIPLQGFIVCIGISILSYLYLNLSSLFCLFSGKLLGGKARFKAVRSALYWSYIPTTLAYFPLLYLAGGDENRSLTPLGMFLTPLIFTVSIWSFVIHLKTLGQVQGFSAWRVLLSIILGYLVLLVGLFLLATILRPFLLLGQQFFCLI